MGHRPEVREFSGLPAFWCRDHGRRPVIAGLPWESWLLLLGSVVVPLAIVIRFFRVQRRKRKTRSDGGLTGGGAGLSSGGGGSTR